MQEVPLSRPWWIALIMGAIVTALVPIVVQWASGGATAQQNNCINYGTARDMNCPAGQQDPTLSERQRYEARKKLEAEKIQDRNANGGCELGTHRVRYPQFNTSLCELND